jgi:hypothetical protein
MSRLHPLVVALVVVFPACELVGTEDDDETQSRLTATSRSATTLDLQWESIGGAAVYTVDYLTGFPTCDFPPMHSDVQLVSGTSVTLTGLTPSTLYNIHVHDKPDYSGSTNVILISTLAAGAGVQPVTATDYNHCED